ncbi:MAG: AAA family ATPase [Pseudomonadota bacterium]
MKRGVILSRLNLVIADADEAYTRGLSEYISSFHSSAFSVSCFTRDDAFCEVMKKKPPADILLVSPEFYEISAGYDCIRLRLLLSDGSLEQEYQGFQPIDKFNTGEKLLSEIMHLYSAVDSVKAKSPGQSKTARIISLYSPAGGAGKTTIAVSMAVQSSDKDKRTFYLSLESVQSTGTFFDTNSTRNLSYVFYYLKEKSGNFPMRLEGIKLRDSGSGVDYFSPPENLHEYGEIDADDLEKLINGIKCMGCYDYIIIDMPCAFDKKSQRVFSLCDHIIMVITEEPVSIHKYGLMQKELERLESSGQDNIAAKLVTVINRYKDTSSGIPMGQTGVADCVYPVPEYGRAIIKENGKLAVDDDGFRKAIDSLLEAISGK